MSPSPLAPALVRAALKPETKQTVAERRAFAKDGRRTSRAILAEHIHAMATQLRLEAFRYRQFDYTETAAQLRAFADKLEGIEP